MKAAFNANVKAFIEIPLPKHSAAPITLSKKAFGANRALLRLGKLYGYFFLLKPCHDDRGKDCHEKLCKTNVFIGRMNKALDTQRSMATTKGRSS
jgi:hypothetical protein